MELQKQHRYKTVREVIGVRARWTHGYGVAEDTRATDPDRIRYWEIQVRHVAEFPPEVRARIAARYHFDAKTGEAEKGGRVKVVIVGITDEIKDQSDTNPIQF